MMRVLKCHTGIGPKVTGEALVADDNFSTRYDLDRINGIFSRPQHKLAVSQRRVCGLWGLWGGIDLSTSLRAVTLCECVRSVLKVAPRTRVEVQGGVCVCV